MMVAIINAMVNRWASVSIGLASMSAIFTKMNENPMMNEYNIAAKYAFFIPIMFYETSLVFSLAYNKNSIKKEERVQYE